MAAKHTIGERLPNGATVVSVVFEQQPDGGTVEDVRDSRGGRSVVATPGTGTPAANAQTLHQRLRDALVNNALFLTGAVDDHDQIVALTRQMSAVIRVTLGKYDSAKGT